MKRLLLLAAFLAPVAHGTPAAAGAIRTPAGNPTLVIAGPTGAERTIPVGDLRFVHFERIFYQRRAPRDEEPSGRRVEVEDRRDDCRCVRFEDYSRVKFKKLRQIEIAYPPDAGAALIRLTRLNGEVSTVPADALRGGLNPLPPRFTATVDGQLREFPLVREAGANGWPEERLVRILLKRPPDRQGKRR